MTRVQIIPLLTCVFLGTIFYELSIYSFKQSPSSKMTLLQHIQPSLSLSILVDRFIGRLTITCIFLLSFLFLLRFHQLGILIYYITFLKFVEFIPSIIDIINILFIYQHKLKDIDYHRNTSSRLILTLIVAVIRFMFSLNIIQRKCNYRWKRQGLIFIDLSLFVLVNISLIRYEDNNLIRLIRVGRKLMLGVLLYKLNDRSWMNQFNQNNKMSTHRVKSASALSNKALAIKMIEKILYIRWIVSISVICLFIFYTFQSIMINKNNKTLMSTEHINSIVKTFVSHLAICMILLYIIYWDKLKNENTLKKDPCFYLDSIFNPKPHIPMVETNILQTCVVCYDDKILDEFTEFDASDCQHIQRSVCNTCLFTHIKQAVQITFTDDIYCPEPGCNIKFNYETVRTILFLNSTDDKLIERYERYVLHRQLEQMDEFVWCTNPKCNFGQLNEGGKLNTIVRCHNCKEKMCFIHKVRWHEGLTCEEYDATVDPEYEVSRRWIVENSKKCPNCPYQIEKNDGCDHMKCIKCHHEFCWSCLANFQPIRHHGNHRHAATCKHYASYHGE